VLELPFGFEIYSLLTRWNPIGHRPPLPARGDRPQGAGVGLGRPATAGAPPAERGPTVVGIDGLKIEPVPESLAGVRLDGSRTASSRCATCSRSRAADQACWPGSRGGRVTGITVRLGQEQPELIGCCWSGRAIRDVWGVRSAARSRSTTDGAGVDHIALCMGAGKPTCRRAQRMAPRRAVGVRLPDGAAAHRRRQGRLDPNLQLRLPVVVIAGA